MDKVYWGFKLKTPKKLSMLLVLIFIFTQIFSFKGTTVLAASQSNQNIQSSSLCVTVDDTFPRIIQYQWLANGAVLYGQEDTLSQVKINGTAYTPTVTFSKTAGTATYNLDISSIGVTMTMYFKVIDNTVEFKVTDIKENGSIKVMTFEIPNQNLVSIRSNQSGAKETGVDVKGSVNYADNSKEEYNPLSAKAVDANPVAKTYLILNTDQLAATICNNAINLTPTTGSKILGDKYETRYYYQTVDKGTYKRMGAWNCPWTYREVPTEVVGLPFCKIAITPDANNDSVVDWQDGAIAYRKIMDVPLGADMVKKSLPHIAYTRGSLNQWPFLRTLDMVKKISLSTDGFGQLLEYKGHQAEGHDSSHPDYGNNFNTRAGGLNDFNFFVNEAAKYNTSVGVHINATEAYPEAKNYSESLVRQPHQNGWNSLDLSYLIDQYKDATNFNSNGLAGRIAELKAASPNLKWVYVDVYYFQGYPEWKLGTELNKNGFAVGTEFQGALENFAIWNHVPQMKSQVVRFIKNGVADSYGFNYMLLKSRHMGSMGYGDDGNDDQNNNVGLTDQMKIFYTNNLLMKYMQNFDITKWASNRIDFTNNVYVKEITPEPSPVVELYKDNKKLAVYQNDYNTSTYEVNNVSTKLFIPWDPKTEDKIYHYNTEGGTTTWDLPNSWSGMSSVKLYQLSDLGKTFVKDLTVTNGQVTIDAKANTPYVVYKGEQTNPVMNWGEGGLVKEPGFDSHGFTNWTRSSTIGDTKHINIVNSSKGETYVNISGSNGADATLSQTITGLTPGKTYQLSGWMEVNGRTGTIGVKDYGGPEVTSTMTKSDLLNQVYNTMRFEQNNMQRIKLEFTVPTGNTSANIYFKANAGTPTSYMYLDDIRVVEMNTTPFGSHYFLEDFESNDEGIGPFVQTKLVGRIHRSELHEGYTTDTISGKYSLKMRQTTSGEIGEFMRTVPYNLKLQPNTTYQMSFKYMLDPAFSNKYSVSVRGNNGQTTLSNVTLPSTGVAPAYSTFTKTFTTGSYDDTYISFAKNADGMIDFVIDDFTIDVLDTAPPLSVPTGLKANETSRSTIDVNWNEADLATGYDLEADGQVIPNVTYPYTHSGLSAASIHTYRVRAKNATGTTEWSAPVTATTKSAFSIGTAADGYVRDGGYADTNYGTATTTSVKNDAAGYKREAYFKFDLSSFNKPLKSAKIKLYPSKADSLAPKTNVEIATTNNWTESTLTWNNKPASDGTVIYQWTPSMSPLELDVTSYVNAAINSADKNITFRLYGSQVKGGSSEVGFYTKENTDPNLRPAIEYTLDPSGVEDVSIQTNVGVEPVMPATVNVAYDNGTHEKAEVLWDKIDAESYNKVGKFEVLGTIKGTEIQVKATVTVVEILPPVITVEGLEEGKSYTDSVTPVIKVDDKDAVTTVTLDGTAYDGKIIDTAGEHILVVTSTNKAGKISTKTIKFTIVKSAVKDTEKPSVPANLVCSGKTDSTVSLSWNPSTDNIGVAGYGIYQDGKLIDKVAGDVTKYTINGLKPGVEYQYTVKAYDKAGNVSDASEGIKVTISMIEVINNLINTNKDIPVFNQNSIKESDIKQIIEAVKGKDKDITFNSGDVKWTFNGKELKDYTGGDIDLTLKQVDESLANKEKAKVKSIVGSELEIAPFSFKYDGSLPGLATVKLLVGQKWANKEVYVCRYEGDKDKLTLIQKTTVDKDGYLSYRTDHCSDYFVVEANETSKVLETGSNSSNNQNKSGGNISSNQPEKNAITKEKLPKTGAVVDMKLMVALGITFLSLGLVILRKRKLII